MTDPALGLTASDQSSAHLHRVMTSAYCGQCHPAIYAEHNQNTHGRAFTDTEPRIATGRFSHGDCIRCHTPRPIFETGIGMNPMRRHFNLEEGITCMTCHWQPGVDYSKFQGGPDCNSTFHPEVGSVEACASCHRNHGTPFQWEKAPLGKGKGKRCMDCHMAKVRRPVAVGEEPRLIRSHVFPGARNERQLRRAYRYKASIEDNQVVITIKNSGTGHNFPTELKQRALESLVVVRDEEGKEVSRSRMVFRDPYKRPYGLQLPVNTQIPSGETRQHRVPLKVANGSVQTELHFKLYYPIEDNHPELARRLEQRHLPFADVTPSDAEVISDPEVKVVVPEGISASQAGIANLVDYLRPKIGTVEVDIPQGQSQEDIERLVSLFMFPVPAAAKKARQRLIHIGEPALPQLIQALGSWDNKTWKAAQKVLVAMGKPARPAIFAALNHPELYVRVHARALLPLVADASHKAELTEPLLAGLQRPSAIDQISAAEALGQLKIQDGIPALRKLLSNTDPDLLRASALALAELDDQPSVAAINTAMQTMPYRETRMDLAKALAMLGSTAGIPVLLQGLDHRDDLIRENFFETFFAVTGLHLGYDPMAPRLARLEAISRLQARWAMQGNAKLLRRPWPPSAKIQAEAWNLVSKLSGGIGIIPGGDDVKLMDALVRMGEDAVPSLVKGLKFPVGFANKRARILECLGRIGSQQAAPFVAAALRDPVLGVAGWACLALEGIADRDSLPALRQYHQRLLSLGTASESQILQALRSRYLLGDKQAEPELVNLLLSEELAVRRHAIATLGHKHEDTRGYDPEAPAAQRRQAVQRWRQ